MCAGCEYVRTVCVTVVHMCCRGLLLLLCLGDKEEMDSLSWMSLVMSCTAWAMREPSLSVSSPLRSSSRFPASFIFSFLQAAGFGEDVSRLTKLVSVTGVLNGPVHPHPTDS